MAAIMSIVFLGEHPNRRTWVNCLIPVCLGLSSLGYISTFIWLCSSNVIMLNIWTLLTLVVFTSLFVWGVYHVRKTMSMLEKLHGEE